MSVRILFFGELSDFVLESEFDLEWKGPLSIETLFLNLMKDHPEVVDKWKPYLLYAVNRIQVRPDFQVQDGDEVAFMPPMSGG